MPTGQHTEGKDNDVEASGIISGALNIFGIKIDLGQLLTTPLGLAGQLDELRERLKRAGGEELVADDAWKQRGASVTGYIRTRGIRGDQEFHIGTTGRTRAGAPGRPSPAAPEAVEPPVDVFNGGPETVIVADVPGVILDDLDIKVEGRIFSLTTKPGSRRSYRKEILLEGNPDPDSLKATCHNGVLEVHLRTQESE